MNGTAIPDYHQLVASLPGQVLEKQDAVSTPQRSVLNQRVEFATHRDPTHHRQMSVTVGRLEYRSLAAWGVSLDHPRHQIERRFVNKDNQKRQSDAALGAPFLSSGQRLLRHSAIAASVVLAGPLKL